MLQLFLYYLCFILSIVGIVLTFHFDGVAETIMGTVVNVCCAVVLFFRSLYAHDVYMAAHHKVKLNSKWIYFGANPVHAAITIITLLVFLTNAILLCVSYPTIFNITTQVSSLILFFGLFVHIIKSNWHRGGKIRNDEC